MKEFSLNKTGKIILLTVGIIIILYLLYFFSEIIIILAVSILISLILDPIINFIERKGISRLLSTLIVFAAFSTLIYFGLSYIIPRLTQQINSLEVSLKTISLQEQIYIFENKIIQYLPFIHQGTISTKLEALITSSIENALNEITNILSNIFSIIALIVIIPFTTFFIVKDKAKIYKGILNILPNKYFEISYWVLKRISIELGKYVRGWVIDAAFVGTACAIGFSIIGIDHALPLGVIAALGHLVPYFGPVIGGIPALIISIIQFGDLSALPFIILVVLIIYFLDNGFVQPLVISKSVDMHPLIIILLIVAGSQLMGILGMLLAVPTVTVIRTASKEIYFAFKNYKIIRT
jgi:predicted PurR-regulated permease PerM